MTDSEKPSHSPDNRLQPLPRRILAQFARLKSEGRAALVSYLVAGDPESASFERLLQELPAAGADIIEVGMPFTDPMADGPVIQAAALRALKQGIKLRDILAMITRFRLTDQRTPIVLMGYFNPIFRYGIEPFVLDCIKAGVDGLLIVDLPPEEDAELAVVARAAGLDFIRLVTPTADRARQELILKSASGFVYFVSVTGITGAATAAAADIEKAVKALRLVTELPIAVGFGIKTEQQAAIVAGLADGVVIGSRIVSEVANHLTVGGAAKPSLVPAIVDLVRSLSRAITAVKKAKKRGA